MKRAFRLGAIGVMLSSALIAVAAPTDKEPRAMSYLQFQFGEYLPSNFHYGLRLDYDSRFRDGLMTPPVLVLDFKSQGLNRMLVGGVDLVRIPYRLNQAEAAAAAGGMSAGTIAAVAVGVVATAVVAKSASSSDDSSGQQTTGSTAGGGTTGDTTGGGTTGGGTTGGTAGGGILGGITGGVPPGFVGRDSGAVNDAEYQDWLDGGTGQMGDLKP